MPQPSSLDIHATMQQFQQQLHVMQVQVLRARQAAVAAQAELALRRRGGTPRFDVELVAQFGEDIIAWELLRPKTDGFFIEAGAFDGYHYSVTYGLEALGWTGLLVEPLPEPAARCAARRPHSRVVQAALSRRGASGSATFRVLDDHYGGMLSYLSTTPQQESDTSWAARREVTVPVTTLDQLLKDHAAQIDLAVIDVEGGELDVLDGFDLSRFRPRVLIIEDNSHGRDPALSSHVTKFGYDLAFRFAVNDLYIGRDDAELAERVKWMRLG